MNYETNLLKRKNINEYSRCFVGSTVSPNEAGNATNYFFVNYNSNNPLKYSFIAYQHDVKKDERISKKLGIYEE